MSACAGRGRHIGTGMTSVLMVACAEAAKVIGTNGGGQHQNKIRRPVMTQRHNAQAGTIIEGDADVGGSSHQCALECVGWLAARTPRLSGSARP